MSNKSGAPGSGVQIPLVRYDDSLFILNDPKLTKGVGRAAQSHWGSHHATGAGTEMRDYVVPEKAQELAADKFSDLNQKMRALRGRQLIFRQESGDFIPAADMVRAAMGETDVWAKWVEVDTDTLAKRVCIVIDTNTPYYTNPEVTQSRVTVAIGLAIALEAAQVQVQVVCLAGRGERLNSRRDEKAYIECYVPKDFDSPFVVSNFGAVMDTDMSRLVTCVIAWSIGGISTNSGVMPFSLDWTDIEGVSEGADQVIYMPAGQGFDIEGVKPDYAHTLPCFRMDQVEKAAIALDDIIMGKEADLPSNPDSGGGFRANWAASWAEGHKDDDFEAEYEASQDSYEDEDDDDWE